MNHSESLKNIAAALLAFQKDAPAVTKDAKANYGKYATLGNVIDSTREALAKNGLSFMQLPDGDGLTTIIMHTSGEWVSATGTLILDKQTPQGLGSALTYGKRYGLTSALGIAADEDDDGAAAEKLVKVSAEGGHTYSTMAKVPLVRPASAKPVAPTTMVDKKKQQIKDLVNALTLVPPVTVGEFKKYIAENTDGLEFSTENYDEIIKRLEVILNEK